MIVDAEYEEIRSIMNNRHKNAGQLPSKAVHFIPEARAESVLALDERIQKLHEKLPLIVTGAIVLSFLIGLAV